MATSAQPRFKLRCWCHNPRCGTDTKKYRHRKKLLTKLEQQWNVPGVTMSDNHIIRCPSCSKCVTTMRGLAQHFSYRPACNRTSGVYGLYPSHEPCDDEVHTETVELGDRNTDADMDLMWDIDDPSDPSTDEAAIAFAKQEARLDAKTQHQMLPSGLDDPAALGDIETNPDRESLEYEEPVTLDQASSSGGTPFPDQFLPGQKSPEEVFAISLLKLLRSINAPNNAYRQVMELVIDVTHAGVKVTNKFKERDVTIRHFARRFKLETLYPTTLTKRMYGRTYPIVLHDAKTMVESILYSSLMREENMLFPNMDDPLAPPPENPPNAADIDTGSIFRKAHKKYCTEAGDVLCPIMLATDKAVFDKHGHLTLEGMYITLGLLNCETRNKVGAWEPIGYTPNLSLISKNESACKLDAKKKAAMYHECLDVIFASLRRLCDAGRMKFEFDYKGKHYKVNLIFFVYAVISDTEGHDRAAGRYQCRLLGVKRICRHCNIPSNRLDDMKHPWQHTKPEEVTALLDAEDWDGLKNISQHPIRNPFYRLDVGGNKRNIHGMSFGEVLHVVDLGLLPIILEQFYIALGSNPKKKGTTVLLMSLDSMARRVGRYMCHQSDRGLPRTYFPNGVTGGTKIAGHEYPGIMLVVLILCNMKESQDLFLKKMDRKTLRKWIRLFEMTLSWRSWLKLDVIPRMEVAKSQKANEKLIERVKKTINRIHGNALCLIKVHLTTHIAENILASGVPANTHGGPIEEHHKDTGKKTGQHTSRDASTFEIQTSIRYIENLIIDTVAYLMEILTEPLKKQTQQENGLRGARFNFKVTVGENGIQNVVSFKWVSKCNFEKYPKQYRDWLARHLLCKLAPDSVVHGCTEQKRQGEFLFRAHPAYRGCYKWHDWALFQWSNRNNQDEPLLIPAQIIFFVEVTEEMLNRADQAAIRKDANLVIDFDSPGMYALIETLEEELPGPSNYRKIVLRGTKNVTTQQTRKRKLDRRTQKATNLYLVSVDTIHSPISAIPDIGGVEGDFLFIRPSDSWASNHKAFIEEVHKKYT